MGLFKTEGLFLSTKQFRRFTGANSLEKGTKSPDIIERNVQRVGISAKWLARNNFNICIKLYC
jgi:hypothetical protein